jgi:predicted alpha/beta-hydrolase family hydrolase
MKNCIALFILLASFAATASQTLTLKSPLGEDIHVTQHIPAGTNLPVVVVAPGQGCNSAGPVFENLATKLSDNGYAVLRFEWSYCNSKPANPMPSPDVVNEIAEMNTVIAYAKTLVQVDATKIVLAGKSLGSIVTSKIFGTNTEVKGFLALTPVCTYTTDQKGNPLPTPEKVCEEYYPTIKTDTRPTLMMMGSLDSLCLLPVLFDFLKDSKGNVTTIVLGGDHGFRIRDSAGNVDTIKTQTNLDAVSLNALNWLNQLF